MKTIAITGGPCSGKSSLIQELGNRGYPVLQEVARRVLEKNKGIRKTFLQNQQEIFMMHLSEEEKKKLTYKNMQYFFLDRGAIDAIAYTRFYAKRVPDEFLKQNVANRYDYVFVLERLPFRNDGTRIENSEEEAVGLHEAIIKEYENYDYDLIPVPLGSIKERADYILDYVTSH
jgi:predicted ATPase